MPFLLFLLLHLLACGVSPLPAGASCTDKDTCEEGTTCLALAEHGDTGCSSSISACSLACEEDADCAALGTGYLCFAGCDGEPGACMQTG